MRLIQSILSLWMPFSQNAATTTTTDRMRRAAESQSRSLHIGRIDDHGPLRTKPSQHHPIRKA
jgi:hypothetical protein